MLKNRQEQIHIAARTIDLIIGVLSFFLVYWLRESALDSLNTVSWILTASLIIHFIVYPAFGFYQSLRQKTFVDLIMMVIRAMMTEAFILGSLVFFIQAKNTSRYFFGLFLLINYGLVLAEKISVRVLLGSIRRRGYNYRQVLIVGTGENALQVVRTLKKNKHWGIVPFGMLREPGTAANLQEIDGVKIIGETRNLEEIVQQRTVDEVYFALDQILAQEVGWQTALCEKLGIPSRFSLGFLDLKHSKITFNTLGHLPVVTFYTTLMTPFEAMIKRLMDIVIAVVGLLITGVVYPWISWRIKRESPGPVIFKQVRVGENGRRFKCYKFRTMYADADARKGELKKSNQMDGPIFKVDDDPRVTPFGAFLRRSSLDELPQFFNILRGDMSAVGTRPPTPDEVSLYETHYRRRLSIKPGLTGLWQVSGRSSIRRFEDILALDLKYIDEWSIWLDIKILCRTIWVTLFRRGAY